MTKLSVPQDGASSACSCSGRRGGKTQMLHSSSGIDHAIEMCAIKSETVEMEVEASARYQQKSSQYSQWIQFLRYYCILIQ